MGIFSGLGSYAKKRVNAGSVETGWDAIQEGQKNFSAENLRPRPAFVKALWAGPVTEAEGRGLYVQKVLPMFPNQDDADAFAAQSKMLGLGIVVVAFALGILAVFYGTAMFKLCAILGFFILAAVGTTYIHRAEQIRERRVFGVRDLLF